MKKLYLVFFTLCVLVGAGLSEARYIDNGIDTVTDPQTRLMWQQTTAPHYGGNYQAPGAYIHTARAEQPESSASLVFFGSLIVSIEPSAARSAGAQWRRVGTSVWRNSGALESNVSVGNHTVEFKEVSGWEAPANQVVSITPNQTTRAIGSYKASLSFASLNATVTDFKFFESGDDLPPAGERQFATFFPKDTTRFINYQLSITYPAPGNRVDFALTARYYKPDGSLWTELEHRAYVDATWTNSWHTYGWGWSRPGNWQTGTYTVRLFDGATEITSGTFNIVDAAETGSLQITIEPSDARAAGAQWRRTGTSVWYNSGATESNLPAGSYTVEFKPLEGWIKPANLNVTITARQTASATGTYTEAAAQHTVTALAGTGGSVSPSSRTVTDGLSASFTVTPAEGYKIGVVSGCGGTLADNTYTTGAITRACTVTASFVPLASEPITITATAGAWGQIRPASREVAYGATTTFVVEPDTGHAPHVTGCNGFITEIDGRYIYTTGTITEPCAIRATFSPTEHLVSVSAGSGGRVEPPFRNVRHGDTTFIALQPEADHSIAEASGCNGELEKYLDNWLYTTGRITSPCTIRVEFSLSTQVGSVQVTIEPEAAREAGAQWRRRASGIWRNSGETEYGLAAGEAHEIEFREIDGWTTPALQPVIASAAETTTLSAHYTSGRVSGRAAILVHPRGWDNNHDVPAIRFMLMHAWRALEYRRLTREEIYLLSYTPFLSRTDDHAQPDPIVNAPVTLKDWDPIEQQARNITADDIAAAFEWAIARGPLEEPLLFKFVGHGIEGALRLDDFNGQITGPELAELLNRYQAATGNKVTVILEACYSGTLLPFLAGPDRIIITSAHDTQAFFLAGGMGSFSRLLFSELRVGKTFYEAFAYTESELPSLDDRVFSVQKPQLNDHADGALARQYRVNTFGQMDIPVRLEPQITPRVVQPDETVDLTVGVGLGAEAVWALIVTPETVQYMDINGYPLKPAPTVDLVYEDAGTWRGAFSGFVHRGSYTVTFHARDRNGFITSSAPVVFTVEAGKDVLASPVPSQEQYGLHDQIRVRIPAAPPGYNTYVGLTHPAAPEELFILTALNTQVLFDGSLPPWVGSDSRVLDERVTENSANGYYVVYLLHTPAGRDPLEVPVEEWRLGMSIFQVQR